MNLKEFNEKIAKLKAEGAALAKAGNIADAEAKKAEIETLTADFNAEKEKKAEENAISKQNTVPKELQENPRMGEENTAMTEFNAASKEYLNAFLKHISGRDDQMTKLENEAFTHTTENTPNVLPTTMLNNIWDLVSQSHVIMGDITIYRTGTILEVVKHTDIKQGKAKKVAEGIANDDEQNTFAKVTLAGNDFSKTVEISYAEANMALPALQAYLETEIANSLGEEFADDAVASIETGLNAGNKVAVTGALKFADVAKAFGSLKRVTDPVVYCTRQTLFNYLVTLDDSSGKLIYQPSATAGVPGTLLGAQVKIEDSVADGKILIADPKKFVYNMVTDIMVETDKDIKTHKYIYSGYARGEGTLIDDKAAAEITITAA